MFLLKLLDVLYCFKWSIPSHSICFINLSHDIFVFVFFLKATPGRCHRPTKAITCRDLCCHSSVCAHNSVVCGFQFSRQCLDFSILHQLGDKFGTHAYQIYFASSFDRIRFSSSISGKALRSCSGISSAVVYVATPIGRLKS